MERVKPEIRSIVNEKLNELIGRAGELTEFARSIDVKRDTVNNWLLGRSDIRVNDLVKIAQVYDVSADYLLGLANSPTREGTQQSAEEYTGLSGEALNALRSFLGERNERSLETSFVDVLLTSEIFRTRFLQALIDVFLYEQTARRTINDVKESIYPSIEAAKKVEQFSRDYDHLRISVLDYTESCHALLYSILPELNQITEELRNVVNPRQLIQADINSPSFTDCWKFDKESEGGK